MLAWARSRRFAGDEGWLCTSHLLGSFCKGALMEVVCCPFGESERSKDQFSQSPQLPQTCGYLQPISCLCTKGGSAPVLHPHPELGRCDMAACRLMEEL